MITPMFDSTPISDTGYNTERSHEMPQWTPPYLLGRTQTPQHEQHHKRNDQREKTERGQTREEARKAAETENTWGSSECTTARKR